MGVGTIVCEVDSLPQGTEVSKTDVKAFFALVDDLWVGATATRAMEEKLYELRGILVSVLVKVCFQLIHEITLLSLIFKL